jgi:hypothetical protein
VFTHFDFNLFYLCLFRFAAGALGYQIGRPAAQGLEAGGNGSENSQVRLNYSEIGNEPLENQPFDPVLFHIKINDNLTLIVFVFFHCSCCQRCE